MFATLPPKAAGFTNASVLSQRANYSNQNPVLFYDNATDLLHLFHSQAPANSGEGQSEIWHLQSNVCDAESSLADVKEVSTLK